MKLTEVIMFSSHALKCKTAKMRAKIVNVNFDCPLILHSFHFFFSEIPLFKILNKQKLRKKTAHQDLNPMIMEVFGRDFLEGFPKNKVY